MTDPRPSQESSNDQIVCLDQRAAREELARRLRIETEAATWGMFRRDGDWIVKRYPVDPAAAPDSLRDDFDEWTHAHPRLWRTILAALLLSAPAGAIWYVLTPDVGSYQVSTLLMLPVVIAALVWLHRRLPIQLQWALAILVAPIGPAGYLLGGGSQWWNWGQATILPLFMLALRRVDWRRLEDGGLMDGPWGPP